MKIQGIVIDSKTGKGIPYANVYYSNKKGLINPNTNIGCACDCYGSYTLPEFVGDLWISASAAGYQVQTKPLPTDYSGKSVLNFDLSAGVELPEVVISAKPVKKYTNWIIAGFLISSIGALWYYSRKRF